MKRQKSVKIENRKSALEVIPLIQEHYNLNEEVSQTTPNKNKPLGALIYVFEYAYDLTLGTINGCRTLITNIYK